MKPKLLKILLVIAIMLPMLSADIKSAQAGYSREYVIDDTIFANSAAMSANDINNFLRSQGSWLADYTIPEYVSVPYPLASGGLSYVDARQFNDVTGEPLYNKTVAQLISDEAVSHGINPRIILTTLQKESSAITQNIPSSQTRAAWPLFYMYDEGMESCLKYGTSCDDAAYRNLSINYGGVAQQIAYATAWFRVRYNTYSVSQSFTVSIDGVTFTCQNAATRILYIYTPHILSWQNFHTIFTSWWEDPTYGPPIPNQPYNMMTLNTQTRTNWSAANSTRIISGDFDADGITDIGSLYDYGNCSMGFIVFESHNSFNPQSLYYTGPNTWCVNHTSNMARGNFDNDGKDDFAVIYDYGAASAGVWLFNSSKGYSPVSANLLPANSWHLTAASEISAGDLDQDGLGDISALYSYGNGTTVLWVFESGNNHVLRQYYNSGPNNFNLSNSKGLVTGDFDGDTKADLATLYDYGSARMGVIVFKAANSFSPSTVSTTANNSWAYSSSSNLVAGNFDRGADTKTDLSIIYDYGQQTIAIFNMNSSSNFSLAPKYWSGRRNFSFGASGGTIIAGDYNDDGMDDISTLYDYGYGGAVLFSFVRAALD